MTLAVGVACPQGAALVTDSLTQIPEPDGSLTHRLDREDGGAKFMHVPTRFVAVHSGFQLPEQPIAAGLDVETGKSEAELEEFARAIVSVDDLSFQEVVRGWFDLLPREGLEMPRHLYTDRDRSAPTDEGWDWQSNQALVAANLRSDGPRLGFISVRGGEQWTSEGYFVGGAAFRWGKDLPTLPAPRTLRQAQRLAVRLARQFHAHCYGDRSSDDVLQEFRDGGSPWVGPVLGPYHLLSINPDGTWHHSRWRF